MTEPTHSLEFNGREAVTPPKEQSGPVVQINRVESMTDGFRRIEVAPTKKERAGR